jgi:protein-S-isoprenylcysteine O-methyltransferase Ste14
MEAIMSPIAVLFLLIIAPALALYLALIGLETTGSNLLGWFLLLFGIAYPAGGVIYYFIRREPFWKSTGEGKPSREEKRDTSFWLILPGFLVVFFAPPHEWMFLPAFLPRIIWSQIVGLALILVAVAILIWARAHIRGEYSGHVEVQTGHHLVTSGPYHFIRHPSYCGMLLMSLGVVIGYASLIGLAGFVFLLLPGMVYRMHVEEKLLLAQFGTTYQEYASHTHKLLPGIW